MSTSSPQAQAETATEVVLLNEAESAVLPRGVSCRMETAGLKVRA